MLKINLHSKRLTLISSKKFCDSLMRGQAISHVATKICTNGITPRGLLHVAGQAMSGKSNKLEPLGRYYSATVYI